MANGMLDPNITQPTVVIYEYHFIYRHALRATLSLLPVFGLQFLFIVYRPTHWPPYEIMAAILTSTQVHCPCFIMY